MKPLTEFKENKKFVVQQIDGDTKLLKKLESLGIRKGVYMKKVSPSKFRGPVVIKFLNSKTQLAIGYGIAKKIFVSE